MEHKGVPAVSCLVKDTICGSSLDVNDSHLCAHIC